MPVTAATSMELCNSGEDESDLRRGPWTREEDSLLTHYIACHGEGRWNLLAKRAGLKRTGKSCRLRWLNYLKPDIKRGNLTPEEQMLILELHHKWGNRWSKIAQYLPGRTDNEIKNYWRTRVQKQARQLNIESNSKRFLDAFRDFWMPRLLQKMEQDVALQQMRTPASTNVHDSVGTALSSYSISADSSSTGLTDSSMVNNSQNYEVLQQELGSSLVGNNASYQPDCGDSYLDDFTAGYYYDDMSAMSALEACGTSPSMSQVEGGNRSVDAYWGVDDDDIWQLRNSGDVGFQGWSSY